MSLADEAFSRLALAMLDTQAGCALDDRFISDDSASRDLAPICRACPLFDQCAEYAELARPKAGYWAGKRYRTNKSKVTQ